MSDNSSIEWLQWPGRRAATWNPTRGCTNVSEGCRRCYARVMAARFSKPSQWGHGFAEMRGGDHRWTGRVELVEERLTEPLKWRAPRCIFVNSTSDLFHKRLPDEVLDRVFAVMALCQQHLLIVLTKRPERMREYVQRLTDRYHGNPELMQATLGQAAVEIASSPCAAHAIDDMSWPLPNLILGVSVEDQQTADERIPHLLATPAACRIVSAEPLLGPIRFDRIAAPKLAADDNSEGWKFNALDAPSDYYTLWDDDPLREGERYVDCGDGPYRETRIDWIITGGESGPGARPAHPDWFRSIRDQCHAAGVAFFFKQHGEWIGTPDLRDLPGGSGPGFGVYDHCRYDMQHEAVRVGKARAGRLLDGREHNEFPEMRTS